MTTLIKKPVTFWQRADYPDRAYPLMAPGCRRVGPCPTLGWYERQVEDRLYLAFRRSLRRRPGAR